FLGSAYPNHIGSQPVDGGIKVVQSHMYTISFPGAHDLLCECQQLIVEDHHMITIPAFGTTDMQVDLGHIEQDRRDLVGDHLSGMEMASIECQHHLVRNGISHVKFM